jgi:RNA polymerase sigma-70 factor (ECF subfamily)
MVSLRPADVATRLEEHRLCESFAPRLLVWGRRRLGDSDAAADLAQEVLVAVVQALREGRVRDRERMGAYVFAVARTMAAHDREVQRRHRGILEKFVADLVGEAEAKESGVDLARLGDCLTKLPPRERHVVHASFFEGREADDIASAIETTAGNVRVIRHRALDRLRECVEKGGTP